MTSMPWFRVYSDILDDKKIKRIARKTGQSKALIIGFWIGLLAIANQGPERGELCLAEGLPIDIEDLIDELGLSEEIVEQLLKAFRAMKMIDGGETMIISNWEKRQFASDSSTERTRKYRERTKQIDETSQERHCDLLDTDTDTDTDIEIDKNTEGENLDPPADEFQVMQHAIEKITGLMPNGPPGLKAIQELVKMHATEEDIQAGYAWLCEQGKPFKYYGQIVGPTQTAMAKRLQKRNGQFSKKEADLLTLTSEQRKARYSVPGVTE